MPPQRTLADLIETVQQTMSETAQFNVNPMAQRILYLFRENVTLQGEEKWLFLLISKKCLTWVLILLPWGLVIRMVLLEVVRPSTIMFSGIMSIWICGVTHSPCTN